MSILWTYRQQSSHWIFRYLISSFIRPITMTNVHTRARQSPYVGTKHIYRTSVSDDKVPWIVKWPDYQTVEYTAESVLKKPSWADDSDTQNIKHYNELDGNIDRRSFMGTYEIDRETNRPKNPQGRTGLSGRGLLGRWGPNHAGDIVVTRWSKDYHSSKHKVLEILLINRNDSDDLALPGGMVDPGEHISTAIKREFTEEAMNSNFDEMKKINKLFENTSSIYKGYIDDPRNTDNAWIETDAVNIHDETGELTKDLKLAAGDDARKVRWIQLDRKYNLYASHESIIQIIIKQHRAYEYWQDNKYLNKSIIDKDTN